MNNEQPHKLYVVVFVVNKDDYWQNTYIFKEAHRPENNSHLSWKVDYTPKYFL